MQVFGQDEALNQVIDKILVSRAGLKSLKQTCGIIPVLRTNWLR
jgi:ATP-dependent Clp protease ATP-binding subunit ClpA